MTKTPSVEDVKKMGLQKKQGQATVYCYTQTQLENILTAEREAGAREYKQFILNVLAGIDIADGECNTKAIRLAIASRIIE